MTIKVKYLSEQEIERDALGLLNAYFRELGQSIQVPIPADEIMETHLGLSLNFDDLRALLGVPGVFGALWVDEREVFIDQSLDPHEFPEKESRFNLTVSHEIGHWQLHRPYLRNADKQVAMFTDCEPEPTVIFCTSQAKERVEWQADYFSFCLTMPRQCVFDAWSKRFGSLKPIVYADIAEQKFEQHADAFETVAREFAPEFRVPIQAMRIRLKNLGLLRIGHSF